MAKKKYAIRLYTIHDLDLVTFMEDHEFNFLRALYSAVTAFSKGEVFVIEVPPEKEKKGTYKRRYTKILTLDTEKDANAIALINKISPGYRNNFFKNLLRQYLCYPISPDFVTEADDMGLFSELFDIFRKDKIVAKAGKVRRKRKKAQKTELNSVFEQKNNKNSEKKNLLPEKSHDVSREKEKTDETIESVTNEVVYEPEPIEQEPMPETQGIKQTISEERLNDNGDNDSNDEELLNMMMNL